MDICKNERSHRKVKTGCKDCVTSFKCMNNTFLSQIFIYFVELGHEFFVIWSHKDHGKVM